MAFQNTLVCSRCRMASPVFRFLNPEEVEKINNARIEVVFNPGETIMKCGSPKTHVISFYSGLAKVSLEGKSGKNFILDFVRPQAFFSGPGLFVDNKHHFTITAVEKSQLCLIEQSVFLDVMKANPTMAFAFIENSNKFILHLTGKLEGLLVKHHHGRVAEALLFLRKEIYRRNPYILTISKQEFADLSGLSRESVSHILNEFSEEGLIAISGKQINILNEVSLQKVSENG